jgi:hypothetical protein
VTLRQLAASIVLAAAAIATSPAAQAAPRTTVSVDRTTIATKLGHNFVIHSTIVNHGTTPATGLIVHLNVLSLRPGLYVDPEDWSTHRTRYLAPIPGGGSITLDWKLAAVNAGDLGVYIAVLPRNGRAVAPTTGPLVHVTIADRRTLDAGGILPLALGIPALLVLTTATLRIARRRTTRAGSSSGRALRS